MILKFKKLVSAHWKALSLIAISALGLVSFVYAYWKNKPSLTSMPATSTVTSYPLEMRTDVNKTEFRQGETIGVKMRLKNISNQTVEASWPGSKHFDFNITDSKGVTVYKSSQMYGTSYVPTQITLQPGEETAQSFEALVAEGVGIDVHSAPLRLPEGEYNVIGFTVKFSARFMDNNQLAWHAMFLQTPPITISER